MYAGFAACIATPLAILLLAGEYEDRYRWLGAVGTPAAGITWLLGLAYILSVA